MEDTHKKSLADRIIRASLIVGLAHICLKFAGLIQAKCCAYYLDDAQYTAVIAIAFGAILNSLFLIGEEVIGPTFLSLFVHEKDTKSEEDAWKFANVTLTFQSILLMAVVAAIVCFPDFFIRLVTQIRAPALPDAQADAATLAAYETALAKYNSVYIPLKNSLRIIAPGLWFLSLGSTTYVMLNGYKKFFLAAFGDASTKICIVIGLVVGWSLGMGLNALCFGILLGCVGKLATHLIGLGKRVRLFRLSFDIHNAAFRSMLLLMLPLLAGILFAKFRDVFNNIYVLTGNTIPDYEAVVKANDLGRKLYTTIQWLVPYALQIALFPFLCELVSRDDRVKLGSVIGNSCRLLLAAFIPLSGVLFLIGTPLTAIIFAGGKTNANVAEMAGMATSLYSLVLPAAAVECVLMQSAFAERKTISVTVIGVISSLLSVLSSYIIIVLIGVDARGALMAVSIGFVASRYIKSIWLTLHLQKTTPIFEAKPFVAFLLRLAALTIAVFLTALLAHSCVAHMLHGSPHINQLADIAATGAAGLLCFVICAYAFRFHEAKAMFNWALDKALRRHKTA